MIDKIKIQNAIGLEGNKKKVNSLKINIL